MRIVAYTFDADVACPDCTRYRYKHNLLNRSKCSKSTDEHGIPDNPAPEDSDGNEVHPVFSTDEGFEDACCGYCNEPLDG